MKFSLASTLVVALAAQGTIASSWFGKPVYNKWHETELERWLSDHNIPYPAASDRKDLENLVKNNWNDKVVTPYNSWDTQTLQNYLTVKGQQAKKGTEKNKDSLAQQVKDYWTETEESANQAYGNVRDWIFDSWTDSQLKAFADKHGIPVPQPRERDSLLRAVRENYQSAANKISENAQYPGDWLYESWSDSDLKSWFDERGFPVPQPTTRDKLIANVRRNSRLASLNMQSAYAPRRPPPQLPSKASATRFSILGPTARSKSGPTRMASRFPRALSATSFLLSLASTVPVSMAIARRQPPPAPMVLLPPRPETITLRQPTALRVTRTGSSPSSEWQLATRLASAALLVPPPRAPRVRLLPFPSLPLARLLPLRSPPRRATMPLPLARSLLPTASRRSCR